MINNNSPIIAAIVAMSTNRVIGKDNRLPWHLPADLQYFKRLTTGQAVIMGRKTYQSIGKALPNRVNIIMTRDVHFMAAGCLVTHNIQAAIDTAKLTHKNVFIIGGSEIYHQALPFINRLYITLIHQDVMGDVFFPDYDPSEWETLSTDPHFADEKNPIPFSFIVLSRKQP